MRDSLSNLKPPQIDKGEKCDMIVNILSIISLEKNEHLTLCRGDLDETFGRDSSL